MKFNYCSSACYMHTGEDASSPSWMLPEMCVGNELALWWFVVENFWTTTGSISPWKGTATTHIIMRTYICCVCRLLSLCPHPLLCLSLSVFSLSLSLSHTLLSHRDTFPSTIWKLHYTQSYDNRANQIQLQHNLKEGTNTHGNMFLTCGVPL